MDESIIEALTVVAAFLCVFFIVMYTFDRDKR